MRKKFVTNLALLLFLNLLIKPFWIFGIDREVQNRVGAEAYGFYFSLFGFTLILNILLDLGLTNFNNRNIAQNRQLLSKHFSNLVVLKFGLAVVYAIVTLVFAAIIGYNREQFYMLVFLIFNQFITSFTLYLRSNLAGLHLFRTDSLISVLDRVLLIALCSFLLWSRFTRDDFCIEWFVYAQTFAYLTTAFITFILVASKTHFLKLRFDRKFFIIILKQSYPFALLTLLMSFYNRVDSVMLERLLPDGDVQAGIYAQSFRVLEATSMFAYLFAGLLLPIFARMIKQKKSVSQLVKLSFALLLVPAICLSISASVFSESIINLLYENHNQQSAQIFSILILGFIPISSTYIFGTLLTANGNLKYLNIMAAIGMVFNVVLNLILIPYYFAFGSAVVGLTTQMLTAIAQIVIAKKIFHFKIKFAYISVFVVFILGITVVAFLSKWLISSWYFALSATMLFGLFLAFSIRLLNVKDIYHIIRHEENE